MFDPFPFMRLLAFNPSYNIIYALSALVLQILAVQHGVRCGMISYYVWRR